MGDKKSNYNLKQGKGRQRITEYLESNFDKESFKPKPKTTATTTTTTTATATMNNNDDDEDGGYKSEITIRFIRYMEKLKEPLYQFALILAGSLGLLVDDVLKTLPTDFENELSIPSDSLIQLLKKLVDQLITSKTPEEIFRNQILLRSTVDALREYKEKTIAKFVLKGNEQIGDDQIGNDQIGIGSKYLSSPRLKIGSRISTVFAEFTINSDETPEKLDNNFIVFLTQVRREIIDERNNLYNQKKSTNLFNTQNDELAKGGSILDPEIKNFQREGINSIDEKKYEEIIEEIKKWIELFDSKLEKKFKSFRTIASFTTKFKSLYLTITDLLKKRRFPGDKIPVDFLEYIYIYVLQPAQIIFKKMISFDDLKTDDFRVELDSWIRSAYGNVENFINKLNYIKFRTEFNLLGPDENVEYNSLIQAFEYLEELNKKTFFKDKYNDDWKEFDELVLLSEPFQGLCLTAQHRINNAISADFTLREYIWSKDSCHYFAAYVKILYLESKPNVKSITNENVQLTTIYGPTKYQYTNTIHDNIGVHNERVFGSLQRYYINVDELDKSKYMSLSSWSIEFFDKNGKPTKRAPNHEKYSTVLINTNYHNRLKKRMEAFSGSSNFNNNLSMSSLSSSCPIYSSSSSSQYDNNNNDDNNYHNLCSSKKRRNTLFYF